MQYLSIEETAEISGGGIPLLIARGIVIAAGTKAGIEAAEWVQETFEDLF